MRFLSKAILSLAVAATLTSQGADTPAVVAPIKLDPAFADGFAALKQAAGFTEQSADDARNDWSPHLQLWLGVKAVEGRKQTIHFVQLTTLPPPQSNAGEQFWQPKLRTNDWSWRGPDKDAATKHAEYVSVLYPVRVRVFDAGGHALKEGQTPMAWGMLTNGLMDMCRLSLELMPHETSTNTPPRNSSELSETENDRIMLAVGGGFLWMMHMFGDLQTVPSVADVWKQAQCAIRMPGAWTMIKGIFTGFSINLQPRLKDVTLTAPADGSLALYRLPLDLTSSNDKLTDVEIIVGPARGAEMLLSGIRSIHAVHPSKPNREFLAQVLATGSCPEEK